VPESPAGPSAGTYSHSEHARPHLGPTGGRVQAMAKANLPFLVLNPLARWRIFWDLTVMLLVLYNLIMVPYKLAFVETQRARFPERNLAELYADLAIDCLFLFDIVLNFLTTFEEINAKGESAFVTHRGHIVWNYLFSWFLLDLVGSVPPRPPPSRTKWTRRVPHPVLIGHAASLTPY
jgi:hypothetical protein